MKEIAIFLLAIAVVQVSCQNILWNRLNGGQGGGSTSRPGTQQPVDCVKEWTDCIRLGNTNTGYRREEVVQQARNGGDCTPVRYEYCTLSSSLKPVDCKKKWGACIQASPTLSYRQEIVVVPAQNGGKCELNYDMIGCRRVDCVKVWTACSGKGPQSVRRQRVVTKPKNGGKPCGKLEVEYDCNPNPVNCVKRWTQCIGVGPSSYREETIVVPAKHGGNKCETLQRETGCNLGQVHCTKKWGPCNGEGLSSYRKEVIDRPPSNGGRPCINFKEEKNCNPTPKDKDLDEDDSRGKVAASLFLQNFIPPEKASSSTGTSSVPQVGERGLSLDLIPGFETLPAQVLPEDNTEKDESGCPVAKYKNRTLGLGCDLNSLLQNKTAVALWEKEFENDKRVRSRSRRSTPANNDIFSQIPDMRDVLFLLDSSGSVGPYRFRTLKQIAAAIVDALCGRIKLHRDGTRISMATFNARQQLSFSFTTTPSVNEVKNKINAVGFDYKYSYQSCIKKALEFIVEKVYTRDNGARDPWEAEGDVIIMTDGCANCDISYQNRDLQRAAYRLKLNKINVYAIGIGIDENCRKILKVLARGGRCFHFFYLDNWSVDAEDFLYRLRNPPKNRCLDRWEFPGINCLAVS